MKSQETEDPIITCPHGRVAQRFVQPADNREVVSSSLTVPTKMRDGEVGIPPAS